MISVVALLFHTQYINSFAIHITERCGYSPCMCLRYPKGKSSQYLDALSLKISVYTLPAGEDSDTFAFGVQIIPTCRFVTQWGYLAEYSFSCQHLSSN